MSVTDRIAKLRKLMEERKMDAYIIPSADNHQSEYVGEHFKARKFIGFMSCTPLSRLNTPVSYNYYTQRFTN